MSWQMARSEEKTRSEERAALEQYEHVRAHPNWFLLAAGHDAESARPVEEHDGYVIIEKSGIAGRIAVEENPRR